VGGDDLAEAVRSAVAASVGKAFRPAHVAVVAALPQTRSGKVVRRAVRARAIGGDPGDLSMLEDARVLDEIERVSLR
jgi:acetyl-CoA synthetase